MSESQRRLCSSSQAKATSLPHPLLRSDLFPFKGGEVISKWLQHDLSPCGRGRRIAPGEGYIKKINILILSYLREFIKDTHGFTLVEMAIVLAILGVIVGLSMPLITHFKDQERKQVTLKHQEIVLTALGTYVARHHQLPCPADPNPYGTHSGMARLSCNDRAQIKALGFIPFRTLGIPEAQTKDAYGHPMYYAINPSLTNKDSFCMTQSLDDDPTSILSVFDETGKLVIDRQENVPLAVVLISEGDAYKHPISFQEIENVSPHLKFYSHPYSQNPQQPFRHFVTWASRDMLITYYGKSTCTKASLRPEPHTMQPRDLMNEPDPLFQ